MLTCTVLLLMPLLQSAAAPAAASAPGSRPAASQPVARIRTYKPGDTVTVDGISYVIDRCEYHPKGGKPAASPTAQHGGKKPTKPGSEDEFGPSMPVEMTLRIFVTNGTSEAAKLQFGTIPLEDPSGNVFRPVWYLSTQTLPVPPRIAPRRWR